jgi:hypothetical protein
LLQPLCPPLFNKLLEEYNARIDGVYDSLKGFGSETEEARVRCEKARQACQEARQACEHEMAQRAQNQRSGDCLEREKLEDQYRAALQAYDDALSAVLLPSAIPASAELDKIDGARSTSRAAIAVLEDHRRRHGCGRTA